MKVVGVVLDKTSREILALVSNVCCLYVIKYT